MRREEVSHEQKSSECGGKDQAMKIKNEQIDAAELRRQAEAKLSER
jgi:hypothetical protein